MKNYVASGDIVGMTAPYDVTSGGGALVGGVFGIAVADVAQGATGQFMTEGAFDLAKVAVEAWAAGEQIYWDDAAKLCTKVATGNTHVGTALAAAANPSATGTVRLLGMTPVVRPTILGAVIADVSTAGSIWVVAPHAGTITGIKSVLHGPITVADATVTTKLAGVAVTDGALTIANAASAAGDVDAATPTGANAVAAGQAIEIATDGGSTTAAALTVQVEITP